MAKFCTNCGRKLKEGETCDCKNNIPNNEILDSIVSLGKGMITKPIDTIKEFTKKENFNVALILIGILSVITSLFIMSLFKNGLSYYMSAMYGTGLINTRTIEIPYLRIFITSIISVMALSFLYAGILYLVNTNLFKRESSFKEIYSMYASCSIIMTFGILGATILSFVNFTLAALVFVAASTLNMVYNYHGLKFIGKEEENKYGYIYLTTTAVFYLAIFIISKIFS